MTQVQKTFPTAQGLLDNKQARIGTQVCLTHSSCSESQVSLPLSPLGSWCHLFSVLEVAKAGLRTELFVGDGCQRGGPQSTGGRGLYLLTSGSGVRLHLKADQRGLGISAMQSDVCLADQPWG